DRTFEGDAVGSWGAHTILASPHQNGFYQAGHHGGVGQEDGPGWGCDSFKDGPWAATMEDYFDENGEPPPPPHVPTCMPMENGLGPYRPSPVPWTTTIMNRMDEAGLPWGIYAPQYGEGSYGWSVCPTFADCLYTEQTENHVPPERFDHDAKNGLLPSLSFVIPRAHDSQHNSASMLQGDNWIAEQVAAVMEGPDWESSAIFITYDDCGCFYDHVPPPPDAGIRVPMVIVSPYARAGFTDSNVATFASMQAYTERNFGLAPMSTEDATAYPYTDSFDYTQEPLPRIVMEQHPLPAWEIQYLRSHPPEPEFT
ncbi:MAG: hypothetical protein H0W94_00365, partial [Actinobacteria bacterium]|nr:hypothetical protein [Actinomycetota bacterium]